MSCSICYEGTFESFLPKSTRTENSSILRLSCGHAYHAKCVALWWQSSGHVECPYCRGHEIREVRRQPEQSEIAMKAYLLFVSFLAFAAVGRMSTAFSLVVSFVSAALLITERPLVPLTIVMCALALSPDVEKPIADLFLRALYVAGPTFSIGCLIWPFVT